MGSMQKIGEINTDATGATEMAGNLTVSTHGTLLIHTKSVTGDWTFNAIFVAKTSASDIIAIAANVTAAGIAIGAAQTDFDTYGQGIPKPTQILMVENSAGAIVADIYWLSAD